MNKVVREHYPVSKLPDDLRGEFAGFDEVTVTIEQTPAQKHAGEHVPLTQDDEAALAEIRRSGVSGGAFSRFKNLRRAHFPSAIDMDAHIDGLRDEWAHRER